MDKEDYPVITAEALRDFAAKVLAGGGFSHDESVLTAQSLVLANLMGHDSHGVIRVMEYTSFLHKGLLKSDVDLKILKNSAGSCVADAGLGLGQVQMPRFLDILLPKASKNGVATGALYHSGHTGRLGEWAEYAAAKGYAFFMAVNDNGALGCVAPPGGKTAYSSTNPLAFGIPLKGGDSFTIDMATSAAAIGKIRLAYLSGESVHTGLIQDSGGSPTTNPATLFEEPQGSLLTAGGHKGFALSLMMDCLAAGLSGGNMPPAPEGAPLVNNAAVTIWDPQHFAGLSHMRNEAEKYLDFVRNIPPRNPAHPVRIPGDRAKASYTDRLQNGIPLSRGTIDALVKRAEKFGIALPAGIRIS